MFKFVVLCAFVAAASALTPHSLLHGGGSNAASKSYGSSEDIHAEIKSLNSDVRADGFNYAFETTNGIRAASSGNEHGAMQGDFEWVSPEGEHVKVAYVADEYGYQPSSNLLPTPPPIPAAIIRSLEYIRNHPAPQEFHGRNH